MICCSVNRDRFIVRLPRWDGLYPNLEEIQGLTSDCTKSPHLLERDEFRLDDIPNSGSSWRILLE
jgi:hypothetical protein